MKKAESLDKPSILIVDDHYENIFSIQKILKKFDVITDSAQSGEEALSKLLDNNRYALILLDVQMPDMDGFETAEHILNNLGTCHIPIIFVTAISKEEKHIKRGYEVGAIDYIFKPVDPSILQNKVSVFLNAYNITKSIEQQDTNLHSVLSTVNDCVIIVDPDYKIHEINDSATEVLACKKENSCGHYLFDYMSLTDRDMNKLESTQIQEHISHQSFKKFTEKHLLTNRMNVQYTIELAISKLNFSSKEYISLIFTIHNSENAENLSKELRYQASHDQLTGLPNRLCFEDDLAHALKYASRHKNSLAVLLINIDGFKRFNECYGYNKGDSVLKEVAEVLKMTTCEDNCLSRIGADEYIFYIHQLDTPDVAAKVAMMLSDIFTKPIHIDEEEYYISISVGISLYPEDGNSITSLMKSANKAKDQAKELGKNNYCFFDKAVQTKSSNSVELFNDLCRAIKNEEFVVYYQPIVDTQNQNRVYGVETLIRWIHPEKGMISPDLFIPVAEQNGLINMIGNYVLVKSCEQLAQWKQEGLDDIYLSINVSGIQFGIPHFIPNLLETVRKNHLSPQEIQLEITETIFINDFKSTIATLNELKNHGFLLAIDDYGTGYSCLSYLRELPIDTLKIDKQFTSQILNSEKDLAIVNSIIDLARNLGFKIIAEGVETTPQSLLLKKNGCYLNQGFLYSKPQPAETILEFCKKQASLIYKNS